MPRLTHGERRSGSIQDLARLLSLDDTPGKVLLVSDRTLYLLANLAMDEVRQYSAYAISYGDADIYYAVEYEDSEATDVDEIANNFGLEVVPVSDIRPIYGFTAAALGADQSIPHNTDEPVIWTTVDELDPEFVTLSGQVFTIKRAGRVIITANAWWAANTTGNRRILIYRNGSPVLEHRTHPTLTTGLHQSASFSVSLFADETLQMFVFQNSGAALALVRNGAPNFNTSLSVIGF